MNATPGLSQEVPHPTDGSSHESQLWRRWRDDADEAARRALLDIHMPYAKVVAASYFGKRLNDEIEFADYLQLASVGLIECVDRFDPSLGVQFRTYAARRMHGSLVDGIERMTEKQQQIAARQRIEEQRRVVIKAAAPAAPAERTGQRSAEQVLQYVADAGLAFALAWLLDGTGMLQAGEASEAVPFYRDVELQQLRQRIVDLVRTLPPQERKVVQDHYFQEQPFDDIADAMCLSKGRISQIHRRALLHLRENLQGQQAFDVSW
ncbi:FliA/WhiG family RNA polymerase sigma factor [Ramlibacter solisilvae]|uniref:Uncharacterized protein n=1 Tax=Ramlibacter tataouinensis TaxID=94132 RepID=A0A127JQG4_9BURK|nr:sigma-70 family RNA polymerase sigma factor [Ramlibacter tataouinensis]AMO22189.1 hypothetical protein UC35_03900 [Ramlibacter tataouinensis]